MMLRELIAALTTLEKEHGNVAVFVNDGNDMFPLKAEGITMERHDDLDIDMIQLDLTA